MKQFTKVFKLVSVMLLLVMAVTFIKAKPAQATMGQGACAVVYNSNSAGGLAVRSVPSTSSSALLKRIPDGTVVRVTGSSIYFSGYTWWPHNKGGWSAGNFLRETTCPSSQPAYNVTNQLNQSVQLVTGSWSLASNLNGGTVVKPLNSTFGKPGQFPLAAPVTSRAGMRSASLYKAVIQQFAAGSNPRYARDSWTYCNTFAGDVMRAMGVPFPVKSSSDPATIGAAPLYTWLTAGNGWRRIYPASSSSDLNLLKTYVNAGKPALAATSGHVAVIRPGQTATSWKELRLAQAGATNSNDIRLGTVWPSTTPAFFIRD